MITIWVRPWCGNDTLVAESYQVAGHALVMDVPLPELAPFTTPRKEPGICRHLAKPQAGPLDGDLVYDGPGWLGNRWRNFVCRSGVRGYRLVIEEVGQFSITPEGQGIVLDRAGSAVDSRLLLEATVGPALILALAQHGTWCLHASAARLGGRTIAFAGESGNGKSTLAAYLSNQGAPAWQRIADDALPLELVPGGVEALPHFPQLKLSPEAQPASGLPERMPLGAVYVLVEAGATDTRPLIEPLSPQEATLTLVRHTVAARLLDRGLLTAHTAFCAGAAAQVPVRRLVYPHDRALLPRVRDLLEADLDSVAGEGA